MKKKKNLIPISLGWRVKCFRLLSFAWFRGFQTLTPSWNPWSLSVLSNQARTINRLVEVHFTSTLVRKTAYHTWQLLSIPTLLWISFLKYRDTKMNNWGLCKSGEMGKILNTVLKFNLKVLSFTGIRKNENKKS